MLRPVRWLLAWLERDLAIHSQLGRLPNDKDDISPLVAKWESSKQSLLSRPAYNSPTPQLEPLQLELAESSKVFLGRGDIKSLFPEMEWKLGIVDLNHVLSFQQKVTLDQEQRLSGADQGDWKSLFSLCLPDLKHEEIPININESQLAITYSSLNPNLRIANFSVNNWTVSFLVGGTGGSFVTVVEYRNRWFLRDGYHRSYGLLKKGITKIPCIFLKAKRFEDTGANQPGFVGQEVLFGDHPPFLKDFLDDQVSVNAEEMANRKIVRIRAEEFIVPI